jgi:hypothetical protein
MSDEKSRTRHPNNEVARTAREMKAVQLYLGEGEHTPPFREIADELGYTDPSTARATVLRGLRKQLAKDAPEVADKVAGRTVAMIRALWPIAMGDLDLVPQWIGFGDNRRPATDPDGKQYVYVVPTMAMLEAQKMVQKHDKTLRDLYGTDHAHGIAERQVQLQEKQVDFLEQLIQALMESKEVGLTTEQKNAAMALLDQQLGGGEPLAIEAAKPENAGDGG